MQLKPFLLDAWLDQYEHDIEFNLAAGTGPTWRLSSQKVSNVKPYGESNFRLWSAYG